MDDLINYLISISVVESMEDMVQQSQEIVGRGNAVMSIFEKVRQDALQEGRQEGEEKRNAEIALEMLKKGLPWEMVMELTRVEEEKLLLLKKQMHHGDTKGVTS